MKQTRSQKEAKLRKAAEEVIEEFLNWDEKNPAPKLMEMEDIILELRRRMGEEMLKVGVEGQEAREPAESPKCAECGRKMRNKGRKRKALESRVGSLNVERGYYHCSGCGSGFSPLDRQLGWGKGAWSEGLEREAVYLSAAVSSFELAATILKRVGQMHISQPSVWRRSQEAGREFQQVEEAERVRALAMPGRGESPRRVERKQVRMGAALDGALMHIRKEGWKETKIGVLFEVEVLAHQDKKSGERVRLAHAVNNSYTAHLGGPEKAGEKLWAEASRRQWEQVRDTIVLGDGAPWIWNQVALHFGQSQQVVDWYHAKEHLLAAARCLKPAGSPAYSRWLNSRETLLYQGHAHKIADQLEQAARKGSPHADALLAEAGYFRSNQKRMNYIELREEEWPIGSGMMESGAKQFKARFSGPGMRWSRSGAVNLLPIRSAVLSARFDHLWTLAKNLPPI